MVSYFHFEQHHHTFTDAWLAHCTVHTMFSQFTKDNWKIPFPFRLWLNVIRLKTYTAKIRNYEIFFSTLIAKCVLHHYRVEI